MGQRSNPEMLVSYKKKTTPGKKKQKLLQNIENIRSG
jgi:hypothetical protein